MVRIRFRRVGARNQPSFRIVAADKDSPRDGRFLEVLGSYNPRTNPSTLKVDEERLFHWMSNGAQPSDSVVQTLQSVGTWERWERFKSGEDIEKLTAEAEAAMPDVDPRTRRDDMSGQRSKKRRKHADAEPKAKAEAAPAAEEEAVEPAEAEAEEPAEAEAEEPAEAEAEVGADAEDKGGAEAEADEGAEAEADTGAEAEASEAEESSEAEPESEGDAEEGPAGDEAAEDESEAEEESE